MSRPVRALVDTQALQANLECVRAAAPRARVLAVIKANGYGHGLLRTARTLQAADAFGVASIDEAVALREAGFTHPILLLAGFFSEDELAAISALRLDIVVHHESQLDTLERVRLDTPVYVWLKIDSGMHRLGFLPDRAADIYRRLRACAQVGTEVRLMTHLANADARADDATLDQLGVFQRAVEGLSGERSIANSAGILGWPQTHADWVRPGLMLYGVNPFTTGVASDVGLRAAMSLTSQLIAINHHRRGDAIGYGGDYRCPEDMPIGVIAIGYGDGYPRAAVTGTPVLVGGRRVSLVGRVSMDLVTVDLREHPRAAVGDEAILWGGDLPVEEVARCAATIPYELLCRVAARVPIHEV
jgi:alanine racemase